MTKLRPCLELRRAALCLAAPGACGTPIDSDALDVWRMGPGIRQEHYLPQLSLDVRTKSWAVAARAMGGRSAAGAGEEGILLRLVCRRWGRRNGVIIATIRLVPVFRVYFRKRLPVPTLLAT